MITTARASEGAASVAFKKQALPHAICFVIGSNRIGFFLLHAQVLIGKFALIEVINQVIAEIEPDGPASCRWQSDSR